MQTWLGMTVLAQLFIAFFARTKDGGANTLLINQLPAFFGVFANGMLAAYLCCLLRRHRALFTEKTTARLGTGFALLFLGLLTLMLRDGLNYAANIQRWQIDYRFVFSAVACLFILALDHAHKGLQWLFSAKPVRFLARISYNLYIWHAPILLHMKTLRIPYYPDAPIDAGPWPQSAGGEPWHFAWQVKYTVLFWVISILLAALLTFCFEEPVRQLLMKTKKTKKHV